MFYEIKTDRLTLRPLDISDLATVHTYAGDKENTAYMFWLPNDTIEETKQFLNNVTNEWKKPAPAYYEFAIVFEGLQIGAISVALNDSRNVGELGWILNKRYWKKGIAIEAASNLMQKIGMTLEDDTGTRTYPKNNETVQELTYSFSIH